MRFRFCGDLDCPDWLLAEINTLARLSSVKMKLLALQVIKSLLNQELEYDKPKKLTADAKFEPGDVQASISAVRFILNTAARHGVDSETLSSELQQLGLPREHSQALVRVYGDHLHQLTVALTSQSLRGKRLVEAQWRVDVPVTTSRDFNMSRPEIQLCLGLEDSFTSNQESHSIGLSAEQLHILLSELRNVSRLLDTAA